MGRKKTYNAPRKDSDFKKYWKKFLPQVRDRDNFHESHLEQLSLLCDLHVEYHKLTQFIEGNGYTYKSDGRYGESWKEYPEVKIRQKTIAEIRQYSKSLGIVLNKDTYVKEDETAHEWQ